MAKGKADRPPGVPLRPPRPDDHGLEDEGPRTSVERSPFAPDEFNDDLITNPGAPAALAEVAEDPFEEPTPPSPSLAQREGGEARARTVSSLSLPLPSPVPPPSTTPLAPARKEGFLAPGAAPAQDVAQRLAEAGAAKLAGAKRHRIIAVAEAGPDWTWARVREIAIGVLFLGLVASALWVKRGQPVAKQRPKVVLLEDANRPIVVRGWKDLYLAQQHAGTSTGADGAALQGVGSLSVFSVPAGAQVFVDRVYRGETPLVLPGGKSVVEVRVQMNGYASWTGMVTPDKNGHATVNAVLVRR